MEAVVNKKVVATDASTPLLDDKDELLRGLNRTKKYISPKYFYDQHGSELFSQIMQLPEYYLTRTEAKILKQYVHEIADYAGQGCLLIEPGAGNCEKVTYLLDAIRPEVFYPQDISRDFLVQTSKELEQQFTWLEVSPIIGDFHDEIILPEGNAEIKRVVFYPGSTIGNFNPTTAAGFLRRMRDLVGKQGGFIIGVDLQKDIDILDAAYNDAQGVTAEFNLNALNHINHLIDGNFDIEKFAHKAFYNDYYHRIEMHLECLEEHTVTIADTDIAFTYGERIHTENSYKYTIDSFRQLAGSAGLTLEKTWLDEQQLFSVHYLSVS